MATTLNNQHCARMFNAYSVSYFLTPFSAKWFHLFTDETTAFQKRAKFAPIGVLIFFPGLLLYQC